MAVEINYNVKGLETFEKALKDLQSSIDKINSGFTSHQTEGSLYTTGVENIGGKDIPEDMVNKSNTLQNSMDKLTEAMNKIANSMLNNPSKFMGNNVKTGEYNGIIDGVQYGNPVIPEKDTGFQPGELQRYLSLKRMRESVNVNDLDSLEALNIALPEDMTFKEWRGYIRSDTYRNKARIKKFDDDNVNNDIYLEGSSADEIQQQQDEINRTKALKYQEFIEPVYKKRQEENEARFNEKYELRQGENEARFNERYQRAKYDIAVSRAIERFGGAISQTAGSVGSLFASSEGAVNLNSLSEYGSFQHNLLTQQASVRKSLYDTTIGGSLDIAAQLGHAYGGIAGNVFSGLALGGKALASYYINKNYTQDMIKATLSTSVDEAYYMLRSQGLAGEGGESVVGKVSTTDGGFEDYTVKLTKLQSILKNKGFINDVTNLMVGIRRDSFMSMTPEQLSNISVSAMGKAMTLGVSTADLYDVASKYSAMKGSSSVYDGMISAMHDMVNTKAMYGGDTLSQYRTAMSIAQTTSMPLEMAKELAAQFQNNPTALNNQVGRYSMMPIGNFSRSILGRIAGLSSEEMHSNILSAAHRDMYAKESLRHDGRITRDTIMAQLMGEVIQDAGGNPYASGSTAAGRIVGSKVALNSMDPSLTDLQKKTLEDMKNVVANNLKVETPSMIANVENAIISYKNEQVNKISKNSKYYGDKLNKATHGVLNTTSSADIAAIRYGF